jgi:hypothetical protein
MVRTADLVGRLPRHRAELAVWRDNSRANMNSQRNVQCRFCPFVRREILFRGIRRCDARTYRPVWEYGGWGVRFGLRGRAYSVSGNRGVQLELVNRKRILIGSRRPEELALAIQEGKKGEVQA